MSGPPSEGPIARFLITSNAVSNMLSLDIGAAMKVLLCGRSRGRKRLDKISPEPLARPMVETVVNLYLRPMFGQSHQLHSTFCLWTIPYIT